MVPHAKRVVPESCAEHDPAVVATVDGTPAIAMICGKRKTNGGTRMGGWHADKMVLILVPASSAVDVWRTMR